MSWLTIDPILAFFFLGVFASWVRSDLEIPEAIAKFLSIYLLLSIGMKGGHEVQIADDLSQFWPVFVIGLGSCVLIPRLIVFLFRHQLNLEDRIALAGCFASVSAITFVTAQSMLDRQLITSSGFMVAVMALMEIPGIIVAMSLYRRNQAKSAFEGSGIRVFSAKSVILLLGGFLIGLIMNQESWTAMKPMTQDLFKGFLGLFLLDLGIVAQKRMKEIGKRPVLVLCAAILVPLCLGTISLWIAAAWGVRQGDQILIATLIGSASYIAAPAAFRLAIPRADPALYVALPMAVTFPFNVILGIPYYIAMSKWIT